MNRRRFLALSGTAAGSAALTNCGPNGPGETDEASSKQTANPVRMHVGTQRFPTTPEMLQYFKRHGVDHICGWPPSLGGEFRGDWKVEDLEPTRELCEKHGISLDMIGVPFLTPLHILGTLRTGRTPGGRGGSHYSTWRFSEAKQEPPLTRAGRVIADIFWERITYFLDRIIPVCNEYQVRAACHPHDPGVPPEGFQGVDRVLGTPEGLKKFVSIQESPYHGLNLCLGTTAEMLQDPDREIHDVIRYFGERQKIFNIHFRNIRGKRDDFMEVWPDEGDMNMVKLATTLYEVDYPYMVMPDHMPYHPDDPDYRQGFAYGYGYIKGILQSLEYRTGLA